MDWVRQLAFGTLAVAAIFGAGPSTARSALDREARSLLLAAAVDTTPPRPVKATLSLDRQSITVTFDEPVLPGGMDVVGGAEDPYKYGAYDSFDFTGMLFATTPAPVRTNETNVVLHIYPETPWIEGRHYWMEVSSVADVRTNVMQSGVRLRVDVPIVFRFGLNGFTGATDVVVSEFEPNMPQAQAQLLHVDTDDPAGTGNDVQVLLRFRNIIGRASGKIPPWAGIRSATLTFGQTDLGSAVTGHRMLVPWDESATWNSLGQGIAADDAEAAAQPDFTIPQGPGPERSVDVWAAVQAWALNPNTPPHGWVLLANGSEGWSCASSEHSTEALRPMLSVEVDGHYDPSPYAPPLLSTSIVVSACDILEIRTAGCEFCPNQVYQWYKDGAPIPGAEVMHYLNVVATPQDTGDYYLVAANSIMSVTGEVCRVTVQPHTTRPAVTNVRLNPDLRRIRVDFSERLERGPTENIAHYALQRADGETLAISNAVFDGYATVVLTTEPRAFGASCVLTISNITGVCSGNLIYPNPTVVTVVSDGMEVLRWDAAWKYEQHANLDETGWQEAGFDDSFWNTGPGLFGFESTFPTLALLPEPVRTTWTTSAQQTTYYLRTILRLDNPMMEEAIFQMRHTIDDGAVVHANGMEAFRFNMTNIGPIAYTNFALPLLTSGDARLQTNAIALRTGTNIIAVEVHQANEASGDVLFGAQIIAVLPPPRLLIDHDATGIAVSWAPPMGRLEESPDLVNWQPSAHQANPHTRPLAPGPMFFRIRR